MNAETYLRPYSGMPPDGALELLVAPEVAAGILAGFLGLCCLAVWLATKKARPTPPTPHKEYKKAA